MKNLYSGHNVAIKDKFLCLIFIFVLNGCATVNKKDISEEMYIKASALTKLTTTVEGTVRYTNPPNSLSDQELLERSTEDDPDILEPFNGYVLKVNREFQHAIILVCSMDGTKGLLEDAGCTAAFDNHLWQGNNSCAFTLRSDLVCP